MKYIALTFFNRVNSPTHPLLSDRNLNSSEVRIHFLPTRNFLEEYTRLFKYNEYESDCTVSKIIQNKFTRMIEIDVFISSAKPCLFLIEISKYTVYIIIYHWILFGNYIGFNCNCY